MLNFPNFLTLIRIATIPFFLILLYMRSYTWALIIFVVGAVTDALDGPVARWTNQKTSLGAYLDPVADKLLILSSLVVLSHLGAVPGWLTLVVVSREFIITLGYGVTYFLTDERMEVQPSFIGKLNTFLLLLLVTVVLISLYDPTAVPGGVPYYLSLITGGTTVVSGLQYVYRGLVWLQGRAPFMTGVI